jgi:hypothetical protein
MGTIVEKSALTGGQVIVFVNESLGKTNRVDDGARTHDHRNHNPALYRLSYIHRQRLKF